MNHITALAVGFISDLLFGDPVWLYHPVCVIGNLIAALEKRLRGALRKAGSKNLCSASGTTGSEEFPEKEKEKRTAKPELCAGILEVLLVCILCFTVPWIMLKGLCRIHPAAGLVLETFWCYQLLAAKSLKTESMKVYDRLKNGTIGEARYAVSMIVGRDTEELSEKGVTKAAVETIAESTSDGIIAPMFYMMIGGAPLMFLYKGINTMDSMLGYKNEKYLYFGRCAAKLDDAANFIPARISGVLMCAAAGICGFDGRRAWKIFVRDRRNHASPNSAHTESAMAGALGVQLAGNACYFGRLYEKPYIGDAEREIEPEDIRRANRLMYGTAVLGAVCFLLLRTLFLCCC